MKRLFILSLVLCWLLGMFLASSCMKDESFSDEPGMLLSFSADTVSFDTVFTSIGSATQELIVYNDNDKGVRLTSVRLASGGNSGFRVNVDGLYGTQFADVEIGHEDSIFVFVEVTVNPQKSDSPVLISDSLLFTLPGGVTQRIILEAYGQDVIVMRGEHFRNDTVLSSKRPYLIYDSLVVDSNTTLSIEPGATLYFHDKAGLDVHGTLKAKGTLEKPITFRGDRLDKLLWYLPYDQVDALWNGIHIFGGSTDNELEFCDIHSGCFGIRVDGTADSQSLTLMNSVVHNVAGHGLDLNYCAAMVGNSQITNSMGNCVNVTGGVVNFCFSTIAQFYPWSECGHALYFTNIKNDTIYPLHELAFRNCIVTGYEDDEIFGTRVENNDADFNYFFANSLVLTDSNAVDMERFVDCVFESDTAFSKKHNFRRLTIPNKDYSCDFRLDSISKARGIGEYISDQYALDRNGIARPNEHPDAGCYQFEGIQEGGR